MKNSSTAKRGQPPALPNGIYRFLLIEDERDLAELICMHLSELEASVVQSHSGSEGLELALTRRWDLVILDLCLPGLDGLDICRALRTRGLETPVLMLTSRSTELDRVHGLELGADDYLVKPFSLLELVARVKALLRRANLGSGQPRHSSGQSSLTTGDIYLDSVQRTAKVKGRSIELTSREFDLLWHFACNPGQVFRRSDLLNAVWGNGHDGYEHTVNSHINRLRAKIEPTTGEPVYLKTVWGIGYKLESCSGD